MRFAVLGHLLWAHVVAVPNFDMHRRDHGVNSSLRGIIVYTNKAIGIEDQEYLEHEVFWLQLQLAGNRPLFIATVYRPPDSDDSILDLLT